MLFFFFFKQKTAYEMRISDWSSDVCSSDLARARRVRDRLAGRRARRGRTLGAGGRGRVDPRQSRPPDSPDHASRASYPRRAGGRCAVVARYRAPGARSVAAPARARGAPGGFRAAILHPAADPRRRLDLHVEMRAAAMARFAELLEPGAALLAQARGVGARTRPAGSSRLSRRLCDRAPSARHADRKSTRAIARMVAPARAVAARAQRPRSREQIGR